MKKILLSIDKLLERAHIPNWLSVLLFIVLLLRIPSFVEPYSYGDEMIYLTLGEAIRQGVSLYKEIHDNKPPLLYIAAFVAGNLFWFKVILAFWSMATIVIFWKLVLKLFPEKIRLSQIATITFALLTTLPLLEGNIANAELFMIGPTLLGFLILFSRKITKRTLFWSGFLFGVAALFKFPAVFDIPAALFLWVFTLGLNKGSIKKIVRRGAFLILGVLTPVAVTLIWFFMAGSLKEYVTAAFLQNIGYLSSFRPGDLEKPFLTKNLPLILRGLFVAMGVLILYIKRAKLSLPFAFATSWLLFTLFAVTLSERPYPHYLIQSVAPVSILVTILFVQNTLEQSLSIIPLTLVFLIPMFYKFYYYQTGAYYQRFLQFALGNISKEKYYSAFDGNVSRNYKVAEFVVNSTKETDRVFVWGDAPPIYALSKRLPPVKFVAEYHINDFSSKKELARALGDRKPKLIVLLPGTSFLEIGPLLRSNYYLINTIDGAQVYNLRKFQI